MSDRGSFIWYDLMTPDADGAAAFYGAVVGWKIAGDGSPGESGVDYRHIVRADGGGNGGVLQLTAEMMAHGAHPGWIGYLYVPDIDTWVTGICADGGKLLMPKMTIEVGSFAMVTDPQGVPFYVMAPIPAPGHEDEKSDAYDRWKPGHISWNELYTSDLDAAKAFYGKYFAFEFNSSMPMGEMGDYCFIDHLGDGVGAMMQKPPHVPMAGWNYYIRVPDIDVAVAAVNDNGGKVLNGPMEVPGGDWIINGVDPQGAAFALVGPKAGAKAGA
jgi:predicted enzyme related to lactoylglutathione lyase